MFKRVFSHFLASLKRSPAKRLARQHQLAGTWAIVSPIHWDATHNDVIITKQVETSREIFNAFQSFVAEEGIQLYYHNASTWLIQCQQPFPKTRPLSKVLQRSMQPELNVLAKHPHWMRFFTEAQMFLSAYHTDVNGI